jgi:hypothetical protein
MEIAISKRFPERYSVEKKEEKDLGGFEYEGKVAWKLMC